MAVNISYLSSNNSNLLKKVKTQIKYSQGINEIDDYKKQIAIMSQQIQFLQQQLKDYQSKEENNKKINQSIMLTYQQSQNYRSQYSTKEIERLKNSYQSTIKKLKDAHYRQTKRLGEQLADQKIRFQQLMIQSDKRGVQFERKFLDLKKVYQDELNFMKNDIKKQYEGKQQILKQKIKQAENMVEASLYKQENYNNNYNNNNNNNSKISRRQYQQFENNISDQHNNNWEQTKTRQSQQRPPSRNYGIRSREDSNKAAMNNSNYKNNREQYLIIDNKSNQYKSRCCSSQHRKSRIRQIEQSNMLSQQLTMANRESVKLLARRIDKATIQLKSSANIHRKIVNRLSKK